MQSGQNDLPEVRSRKRILAFFLFGLLVAGLITFLIFRNNENNRQGDRGATRTSDETKKSEEELHIERVKEALLDQYQRAVPIAIEEYLSWLDQRENELIDEISAVDEVVALEIGRWASDKDGIIGRFWENKEEQKESAYSNLNSTVKPLCEEKIDAFVDDANSRWIDTMSGLYIGHTLSNTDVRSLARPDSFASPGALASPLIKAQDTPEIDYLSGIQKTLNYLQKGSSKAGFFLEEAGTFIPWAGDAYDLSRLKYNWRIIEMLEPFAEEAGSEVRLKLKQKCSGIAETIRSNVQALKPQLESFHDSESLYLQYQLNTQS